MEPNFRVTNSFKFSILSFKGEEHMEAFVTENERFVSILPREFSKLGMKCRLTSEDSVPKTLLRPELSYQEERMEKVYSISLEQTDEGRRKDIYSTISKLGQLWCSRMELQDFKVLHWLIPLVSKDLFTPLQSNVVSVKSEGLSFGTFLLPNLFIHRYTLSQGPHEIFVDFFQEVEKIVAFFEIAHSSKCNQGKDKLRYKMAVPYGNVLRLFISEKSDQLEIFLNFHLPPILYKLEQAQVADNFPIEDLNTLNKGWNRSTRFGCKCKSLCTKNIIGQSTVLKVMIENKNIAKQILIRLKKLMPSKVEFVYTTVSENRYTDFKYNPDIRRDPAFRSYDSVYAWNCLTSIDNQLQDQYKNAPLKDQAAFFEMLLDFEKNCPLSLQKSLFSIFYLIRNGQLFNIFKALPYYFKYHRLRFKEEVIPEGMYYVKKLILTPYKTIILPFQPQMQNRILRNFESDYCLLVSIKEDSMSKLHDVVCNSDYDEFIKHHFVNLINSGIRIGERRFKFLAASTSQIRDQSFWMYADIGGQKQAHDIRNWIGFDEIKGTAAKKLARMGLAFSSLEVAIPINRDYVENFEDIKVRSKSGIEYNFSDGMGMISSALAEQIRSKLCSARRLDPEANLYKPCAFQIRYLGYKGMLLENPDLHGNVIKFRDSMQKFDAGVCHDLEIIKTSAPRQLYLNRPLITILEQKGVREEDFMKLQEDVIIEYTESLIYEEKAVKFLMEKSKLKLPFRTMYESGISLIREPFFRSLLIDAYKEVMGSLKKSARIPIPHGYGRNMLGVLDETGTLGEGQVFVQYSREVGDTEASELTVLKGSVVVTKNPGLHPGDVRLVQAVDVPQLHHVKDCIVFPSRGARPLTDMLSGSDLDGDEYVVLWYPGLLFKEKSNSPPMDYPKLMAKQNSQKQTDVSDLVDFIFQNMKLAKIGLYASAHLALADQEKEGIYSDKCLKLAEKYPYVLDFAKCGVGKDLAYFHKPSQYPDFMEKGFASNSYKSQRVLGQLYQNSKNITTALAYDPTPLENITPDPALAYPGWEDFADEARRERDIYKYKLSEMLKELGLNNKEGFLVGNIISENANLSKKELENIIRIGDRKLRYLIKQTKEKFKALLKGICRDESCCHRECELKFASAWYMVTYTGATTSEFLSFPWCVADILCRVRVEVQERSQQPIRISPNHILEEISTKALSLLKEDEQNHPDRDIIITGRLLWSWVKMSVPLDQRAALRPNFNTLLQALVEDTYRKDSTENIAAMLMKFFEWLASNSRRKSKINVPGFEMFQKKALICYTCFPLTLNLEVLYYGGTALKSDVKQSCFVKRQFTADHHCRRFTMFSRQVARVLQGWSGCEELSLQIKETPKYTSVLVSGLGDPWQCLELEDIVFHPDFFDLVDRELKRMNL